MSVRKNTRLKAQSGLVLGVILLMLMSLVGIVWADGTGNLGPPSISIESGSGVVASGTGLGTQPSTIEIAVPEDATVKQVLLYWEGQSVFDTELGDPNNGDDIIAVDGMDVQGTLIGGPAFFTTFNGVNFQTSSFRADVTVLGLIAPGDNSVEITGFDGTGPENTDVAADGAALFVIFDDDSGVSEIDIRDGNDFVIREQATSLQTYTFTPADEDRVADLILLVADGTDPVIRARTSTIQITVDGQVTELYDLLVSNDGDQWDTISLSVDIPANSGSLTVQILSDEGDPNDSLDSPESFVWVVSALSVPVASIDIQKFVLVQDQAGDNLCDTFGKPRLLAMELTGGNEISPNLQEGKAKLVVDNLLGDLTSFHVIANDKDNPFDSRAKKWFEGHVAIGEMFDIDAGSIGESKLKAETRVHLFDSDPNTEPSTATLLQTVKFHTSCSKPLNLGDQFGAVRLIGFTDEGGFGDVLDDEPQELGLDANTPETGPDATEGDTIIWSYVVTNDGSVPLTDLVVTDDHLDVVVDCGGQTTLALGETIICTASGNAIAGPYVNVGTADAVGGGFPVSDDDPAHYSGEALPVNVCEGDKVKLAALTMELTGGNEISPNLQEGKAKLVVDNDLGDLKEFHVIANDKDNPFDSKAKTWFEGHVAIGEMFDIIAAAGGQSKLKADTRVHLFDSDPNTEPSTATLLQTVKFHTSCSKPLNLGDQFGAVQVFDFILE